MTAPRPGILKSEKPLVIIFAALAMIVLAIGALRLSGYHPASSVPEGVSEASRRLQFEDAPQGSVIVRDANTGEDIHTFQRAEGSFVRATLRALVNNRKHQGIPLEGQFRLDRFNGHQLFLTDEATGRSISLNAFGPSNTAVFAAFMSNQKG